MVPKPLCDLGPAHFDLFYHVVKVHLRGYVIRAGRHVCVVVHGDEHERQVKAS